MILTGKMISTSVEDGRIKIDPFCAGNINPNSYNYRLGRELIELCSSNGNRITEHKHSIPDDGFILKPGRLYLGCTFEKMGSNYYCMTILGRSSIGRLGIFLNVTADLGHCGSLSNWTLEIHVVQPVRVFPLMQIGQMAWWLQSGTLARYSGVYHEDDRPVTSQGILY